MRWKGSHWLNI